MTSANEDKNLDLRRQWLAVLVTSLAAFMAVIDITMNNASLHDIQGTLGASMEETSWIMTSYLIGEVIAITLSGWLTKVFSPRGFLLFNTALFVMFSVLCGLSRNLPMMIFARFFQGLFGGVLIPLAASTVMKLPSAYRAMGLSIMSVCLSMGPALGPCFGGWITSQYGWQVSFFINLLPGLIVLIVGSLVLDSKTGPFEFFKTCDWFGILTMSIGFGALIFILEEGNRRDWLGDKLIVNCTFVCVVSLALFFWIELKTKIPLLNLRLFSNKNYALGVFASGLLGAYLLGNAFIMPSYLLHIQNYNAFETGKIMIWGGPLQIPFSLAVPFLLKFFRASKLVILGGCLFILSSFMNSTMTHLTAGDQFIIPQIIRAIGSGLTGGSLSGLTLMTIEQSSIPAAVAIFSLMRTLGAAVAIAGFGTFLSHRYLFHFSRIGEHITQSGGIVNELLERGAEVHVSSMADSYSTIFFNLGKLINREAYIMAFGDVYLALVALVILLMLLVAFIDTKA